jgi:PAS domain S-box-containing protein
MKLNLNRNLQIGYGSAILIIVIVGVLSSITLSNMLSSNEAVTHSNVVISKLENTLSVMTDAETGQRGYLLTGNKSFLEPYNGAYEKASGLIDEVKAFTADNPSQQRNLTALKTILINRLNILKAVIEKKQRGGAATSADLNDGKAAMDALRNAVHKAENDERELLNLRTARLNSYIRFAPPFILLAIALAVAITLFSYFSIIRDAREKERLQTALAVKEQETAAFNEELAAGNEELIAINDELEEAKDELAGLNRSLEERVKQRTRDLQESEEETQALNEELTAINEELASANEEMHASNEELAKSRDELQKSEALFKSIAINIPKSLIIVLDKDQRLIAMEGDQMKEMGFDNPDYAGRHLSEVVNPKRFAEVSHLYDRLSAGEQFTVERKVTNGNYFRIDFVPLRDERGEVYAGLVIALDISDIKQAEERSAKLAAIVESSDDAIISKTLDGIITSWNHSAERLFGYPEAEMIGQPILKLLPQDRQDEEPRIIARIRSGERVEHFETLRLTKAGKQLDVSLTISPVKNKQGEIIGVSKIVRDISEKKRDEQRKNDFIGMVSHELKTPLTSLTALIQAANLKLRTTEDAFLSGAMEKANIQARKMAGMINGFLNISRLESSQIQIDKEELNLGDLLQNIIHDTELTMSSHRINFNNANTVMVNVDRDKIGSVVSNLLSNAVKYSPKGTSIDVNLEITANGALVSVRDEGMGIPQADQPKLFERFYRVQADHTRHISGFGIGLYLSEEIVRRHDGVIWVKSELGKGATFYFSLPLA